jgi:hypothetical protein
MKTTLCNLKLNVIMGAWFSSEIMNFKSKDLLVTQDSSVGIVTDGWGSIPGRGGIFLFSTASRPALGPTEPPIQLICWGLLQGGVKRPGCESDKSPPSSAEYKNDGAIPPLPLALPILF